MAMPIEEGIDLIEYARKQKEEARDWEMWLQLYPRMDPKKFIGFDEFRERLRTPVSLKPAREILKDSVNILRRSRRNRGR